MSYVGHGIRVKIAKKGYRLGTLINDSDWRVRCEVAKHGYRLDILVHDENWQVRYEVAKQGYRLDILMYDEDWAIRREVVKQGYRLDILVHDSLPHVSRLAKRLLGSKRHVVDTSFGTYKGDLLLYTWNNRYFILSGCYSTYNLAEWEHKCKGKLDKETATKYAKIMKAIIEEEVK